jgi:hypothetical protein
MSNSSKALPFLVLAITAGLLAIDVYSPFEITETHASIITSILATLGLGGVYNKAFKEGFSKFQKIKQEASKTSG